VPYLTFLTYQVSEQTRLLIYRNVKIVDCTVFYSIAASGDEAVRCEQTGMLGPKNCVIIVKFLNCEEPQLQSLFNYLLSDLEGTMPYSRPLYGS